ncbi:MAG: TonB-like protein [Novosphingobium sp.]|nr:TonB-like protein [Novosphingobium sp.]
MSYSMVLETPDWKTWLTDRVRGTNWVAAAIAAALQVGFLAVLILMGIVPTLAPKQDKPLITVLASTERAATPPPPAAVQQQQPDKPVVQPKADVVIPPTKVQLSASQPVAAAAQRAPDPPAPAPAAPSAPSPSPPSSSGSGPVKADLTSNLLNAPSPVFPLSSRRKHESGTVVLRVIVGEDGRVDQVSVQRSSGFAALDEAALSAVRKWRWSRTMRDGRAVIVTGAVAVNMVLRET